MLNRKLLCASLIAGLASIGVSAHAQDRERDHDRYQHDSRVEQRSHERDAHWGDRRDDDARVMNQRDWGRDRRGMEHEHGRYDARAMGGPGRHHWQRGERLPDEYRHGGYVNWRSHHLHAPPRGYQWVQVDGDYVLVALTTGLIADLIINSR